MERSSPADSKASGEGGGAGVKLGGHLAAKSQPSTP